MATKTEQKNLIERPPVVVIMGHIDHGKSTLLDFIRKSNVVEHEAGRITQHLGAYEIEHTDTAGKKKRITFLDTPGHEAFKGVRSRGAEVADIAILIVSAEDGVMPQTLEAYKCIKNDEMQVIVAINKIDAPRADIVRAKNSLIENEIYVEGMGGSIPVVEISAKTGKNIGDLLDLILLSSEVENLVGDFNKGATGYIVEVNKDKLKGISATLVIKDGTINQGDFVVCEDAFSPIRIMEDQNTVKIKSATFSTPVHVSGWNKLPNVGAKFETVYSKKEAEKYCDEWKRNFSEKKIDPKIKNTGDNFVIPVIIKADTQGSIEAIEYELSKIQMLHAELKVVISGTGNISEKDAKIAGTNSNTLTVGFGVDVDKQAEIIRERAGLNIKTFKIIYELVDWIKSTAENMRPRVRMEEKRGLVKVIRIFNKVKSAQVFGGKVTEGVITVGNQIKVLRRGEEICRGVVKGLQQQKTTANEVSEGSEFGSSVEAKMEIAIGDEIEAFEVVEK